MSLFAFATETLPLIFVTFLRASLVSHLLMAAVAKPAATAAYGASPTLSRAVPSRWPSPLKFHQRCFAWALATAVPVVFYAGPLLLMAPPFLYLVNPRAALALLVFDGICIVSPANEWPWFRGVFQCW